MFGYIIPDKPNLYMKDYVLYRSIYCGICVATGKQYGQFARLTTNYDIVFLSALIHDYLGVDMTVDMKKCVLHPFKKRPIAKVDEITEKICACNIMLVYYNLTDDIIDEGTFKKKVARRRIKSAYKKVSRNYPEMEIAVKQSYEKLQSIEKSDIKSIDMIADCFAVMMKDIAKIIIGENANENIYNLSYNFGKWVYLIDAVDDLEKDFEKNLFNPYIKCFGNFTSREQFILENKKDIEFSLDMAIKSIQDSYSLLPHKFNHDLTDNIIYKGIIERTKGVLDGTSCGKTPKI